MKTHMMVEMTCPECGDLVEIEVLAPGYAERGSRWQPGWSEAPELAVPKWCPGERLDDDDKLVPCGYALARDHSFCDEAVERAWEQQCEEPDHDYDRRARE